MAATFLIVRCGDTDDYHAFDTIEEVAEYLHQCGAEKPYERRRTDGLFDRVYYVGQNYISLYRGNWPITAKNPDPNTEITDQEFETLNYWCP